MNKYYIYIITNMNKTVLYIGVTNNLQRRLDEHRQGKTGSFTAKYRVWHLLYFEEFNDIRYAIAREKEIKGWKREKKNKLIETTNPSWEFLNEQILRYTQDDNKENTQDDKQKPN